MVKVGDQVTVNQHLFDIIDFDSIVARIYVPEKELVRLRVGQVARILAEAAGSSEHRGEVDRIAPRVDPRSGTVKVTVAMPPSEGLLPGMYVTVELITEIHEDAVLVPKKALVYDAEQLFVFRLKDDNSVQRLLIRPALEDRDNIEPAGVLEAGDQIVIAGQASLKDGSQVRLVGAGTDAGNEPSRSHRAHPARPSPSASPPSPPGDPVAITMVFVAAVVFGYFSYGRLPVNLMPELSYPTITVRTEYPGSAPEEVENDISRPVEEALGVVGGLRRISSISRAGVSDVVLEFTWDTEMSQAIQDSLEKLDLILLAQRGRDGR